MIGQIASDNNSSLRQAGIINSPYNIEKNMRKENQKKSTDKNNITRPKDKQS